MRADHFVHLWIERSLYETASTFVEITNVATNESITTTADTTNENEYFGLFNAQNAKIIAFIVLIAVAPYHSILHFLSIS